MKIFLTSHAAILKAVFADYQLNPLVNTPFQMWESVGKDVVLMETGIGKVSAAACTTYAALRYADAESFMNIDIAGAMHSDMAIGNAYKISYAQFFDVDMTAFGYEKGQLPDSKHSFYEIVNPDIPAAIKSARCISGDHFVTDTKEVKKLQQEFSTDIIDQECAAIAHTLTKLDKLKKFNCLKIVSERADRAVSSEEYARGDQLLEKAQKIVHSILDS